MNACWLLPDSFCCRRGLDSSAPVLGGDSPEGRTTSGLLHYELFFTGQRLIGGLDGPTDVAEAS